MQQRPSSRASPSSYGHRPSQSHAQIGCPSALVLRDNETPARSLSDIGPENKEIRQRTTDGEYGVQCEVCFHEVVPTGLGSPPSSLFTPARTLYVRTRVYPGSRAAPYGVTAWDRTARNINTFTQLDFPSKITLVLRRPSESRKS